MEDAGTKFSEIQAVLGHADLGASVRDCARLHQGENRHPTRLSGLYFFGDFDQRVGDAASTAASASLEPSRDTAMARESTDSSPSS
jgi:hypothetical protein